MNNNLKEQLVNAMRQFKKVGMNFPAHLNISMSELFLMNGIEKNAAGPDIPVNISEIQCNLHITKPAVSQMLNALEQKGYVLREIDQSDRRKISVSLTAQGMVMLLETRKHTSEVLDQLITRFGEDNTRDLIRLLSQLADVSEELKQENF